MLYVQSNEMSGRVGLRITSGFTLVELMISIAIMGILMALASVGYGNAQKKARDSRRIQDVDNIQKAAEQYYLLSGVYSYPTGTANDTLKTGITWMVKNQVVLGRYPGDPKSGIGYSGSIGSTGYCICGSLEGSKGNSLNSDCDFSGNGDYYCVKNKQ